ncbi:uncharacterized protein KQ657_001999 [Scheffersomyces spartinae]|uniref:Cytochrome b5 heme-binding domain-containing protein n=1 Tax=Scheffersomyces spartinae TaxID=45513 RepID=A0A9P8AGF2_9ASCO|nr:uncharacterized protein KQ657_001999 [Scheffersomyces spartinae]KAG7192280.1 hypothetical protein KQ657_001999 [Scheffersomyces spartinae]
MTRSQLALYNGEDKPEMYVAIKGYVYDVTSNAKSYGPGKAYHSLVARDCSRMLGMNILNVAKLYPEDGNSATNEPNHRRSEIDTWSVSDLTERQQATVDKWELFFKKRYRIVAVIVDHGFKTV